MKLNKEDLAYTAGIIDGEGCIKVYKVNAETINRPNNRYTLGIQVNMVDKKVVKWLHNNFGGYFYLHPANIKNHPNWRDSYRWYLQNQHCIKFLNLILKYLKIKQKQAIYALEFLKLESGDIKRKHSYWKKFRILNKIGRLPQKEVK